jgi:hypothetical protein
MLVVKYGTVTHSGKNYHLGEILPKLSKAEADRLLKLDVAAEVAGETSGLAAAPDTDDAVENVPALDFSPDASIKAKK